MLHLRSHERKPMGLLPMRIFSHVHFSVLVLVVTLSSPTFARDIFVDNVLGDDRSDGVRQKGADKQNGPVRSIARAIKLSMFGDRIVLVKTAKPYRESISLVGKKNSGSRALPFTIIGNGVTLDGTVPVPDGEWRHYRGSVFYFRLARMGPQKLFLEGRPAARVIARRMDEKPPELERLQWCSFKGRIFFRVEDTKLPRDYDVSYAHARVGLTLFHVQHVVIDDLIVQGFRLDGINAHNSARGITLVGVTSRGNGRSGVSVGGASHVKIEACLLGDNGEAQLLTLPYSETRIGNSDLIGNTAPAWVDWGGRVWLDGKRVQGGRQEISSHADKKSANSM